MILAKIGIFGQWQRHEQGFSLIELMIAASILATLSYFGMQLMEGQLKTQKGLEKRFESLNAASEIQSVLAHNKNCLATFEGINLKEHLFNQGPLSLEYFIKLRKISNDEVVELKIWPINKDPSPPKKFHLGPPFVKMRDYEKFQSSDEILQVDTYLYLPFHWESITSTRRIPLSFELNKDGQITNCSSVSNKEDGKVMVIDPTKNTAQKGRSGHKACESLGKKCIRVYSQNYATTVYGQVGLDNLCETNYNQGLVGVKDGANLGAWHDCDAKLGVYETYKIDKKKLQLSCNGIFMAMCQ